GIRDDLVTGVQTCALPIYATKKPLSPTSAAIVAILPIKTPGASQCSLIVSAMGVVVRNKNRKFIARMQPHASGTLVEQEFTSSKIGRASCRDREESSGRAG